MTRVIYGERREKLQEEDVSRTLTDLEDSSEVGFWELAYIIESPLVLNVLPILASTSSVWTLHNH